MKSSSRFDTMHVCILNFLNASFENSFIVLVGWGSLGTREQFRVVEIVNSPEFNLKFRISR